MQHPEELHEMKEDLVKELKAKLTIPPDVRAILTLSVPKCGEIKFRSFAAELLLVHYGEENMSISCYTSCDCHMISFLIDWSIEKVLEEWKKDPFETLKNAKLKPDDSLCKRYICTHAHSHTHTRTHVRTHTHTHTHQCVVTSITCATSTSLCIVYSCSCSSRTSPKALVIAV